MTRKSSDPQTNKTSRRPGSLPGDGTIRREDITPAFIDRLERQVASLPGYSLISHEERETSRQTFLAGRRKNQGLWVFGYGSLMWNPAIHVARTARSTLFGYHRAFCLHLVIGRGSPKKPGLMLGLDAGGSCVGLAHHIAPEHVESETEILWLREMVGTGYVPKTVKLRIGSKLVEGLTFVANRQSKRYAGRIPFKKAVRRMASAEGDIGTNRDYLYRTIAHLNEFGLAEGPLHALERAVRERAGDL
ncbi:gamma-glutamylcyclotransferase [Parvibaculaceae bacterium PLY_AMNH_Bact1]|nr:gamma-glutamylcyclotransferase [Parvibaculaceae bacterium PLY_AMNH_Bact1]